MSNTSTDEEISDEQMKVLIEKVLEAEKEKLPLKSPRNIRENIEEIIREEVK